MAYDRWTYVSLDPSNPLATLQGIFSHPAIDTNMLVDNTIPTLYVDINTSNRRDQTVTAQPTSVSVDPVTREALVG